MAGTKNYSWIRVLRSDKERMEVFYRKKGITNHAQMFKRLMRGKN